MSTDTLNNKVLNKIPTIALRGLVAFPGMPIHFDAGRSKTINTINFVMEKNMHVFLVAQKDIREEDPVSGGFYDIGCVAVVRQTLKVSEKEVKVLCEGLYRARITEGGIVESDNILFADIEKINDSADRHSKNYKEALTRKIRAEFERYSRMLQMPLAPDIALNVAATDNINILSNYICANIPAPVDDKQYVLEQLNPSNRGKVLLKLLKKECDLLVIDNKISQTVKQQIDDNQREYYLREQIKAINEELYGDAVGEDGDEYYDKIAHLDADKTVKQKLCNEVAKLLKMPQGSHEITVSRNYLDTCLDLPWRKCTAVKNNLSYSKKVLDRDFYGMEKVKERILEMLSVYTLAPDIKGQIICLVGPPGVGKTSIAKTVAECMGRNFARVSLGGVADEAEIRGHRKTYIGAMPGKIISAVKQAGSANALILLDEIDKLGRDHRGDPSAALLEVLDGEQNTAYSDHYIDMPYDLSKIVFLTTANTTETIPAPLLDRLEIIELTSYTREEKFNIAKKHLVKKELARHGLNVKNCRITDSALYSLIDYYTRESGVRNLERKIATLCRKAAKLIVGGQSTVIIKDKQVVSMLGKHRYNPEVILKEDQVGIINGLAWTSVGGEIMQLEVSVVPGTGKLVLTGSLGDVMQESAKAAVTYVRSRAEKLGISVDFYKTMDIHIHATEAAVPKDGPSAGVTMTTALISALTNRPVRRDIAMTGEITIRGRVLPIGGLKEKSMAAYRGGVKTVFIPYENIPDLEEVDKTVKESIEFVPVKFEDEIIDRALL